MLSTQHREFEVAALEPHGERRMVLRLTVEREEAEIGAAERGVVEGRQKILGGYVARAGRGAEHAALGEDPRGGGVEAAIGGEGPRFRALARREARRIRDDE